jgi:pyrroloquinoline quinone biosynthesis protein B
LPQWNCACLNCQDARRGRIPPRTQSSVAISEDGHHWFLVNASPDLPGQIQKHPDLQPAARSFRNSPISGVLLTNADLDHVLGLFSLREGGRLNIHATAAVREALTDPLGIAPVLDVFCGASWREPPVTGFAPVIDGNLRYRAIALPGTSPPFAKGISNGGVHSVAYQFLDQRTGGRLLVAPDVAGINDGLREALETSDAVLFDGTFWSDDELSLVKTTARGAAAMGHLTIKDGSLDLLGKLAARRKIYFHINNTNPILSRDSAEKAAVEAAGITIGYDGLEFEL